MRAFKIKGAISVCAIYVPQTTPALAGVVFLFFHMLLSGIPFTVGKGAAGISNSRYLHTSRPCELLLDTLPGKNPSPYSERRDWLLQPNTDYY